MEQQAIIHESAGNWAEIDTWRSIWYALATVNGTDPAAATARHRDWCVLMGLEPAAATTPVTAAFRQDGRDATSTAYPVAARTLRDS